MKVQEVKYVKDYTISVKFDDGTTGNVQFIGGGSASQNHGST